MTIAPNSAGSLTATIASGPSSHSGCVIHGAYPDPACTTGSTFNVTKDQICVSGYSSSVRDVPETEKYQVYAEYGITSHITGQYEIDHFISLELGGSNDITNLWPEASSPEPGFHEKDKVENYLHEQVCKGAMSLAQAQFLERTDWVAVYYNMGLTSNTPIPTHSQIQSTEIQPVPVVEPTIQVGEPTVPVSLPTATTGGNCDPSYPDACLQDGIGDYDCAGGDGNGPNYIQGPIRVLTPDPFGLDNDGDGIGCDK